VATPWQGEGRFWGVDGRRSLPSTPQNLPFPRRLPAHFAGWGGYSLITLGEPCSDRIYRKIMLEKELK